MFVWVSAPRATEIGRWGEPLPAKSKLAKLARSRPTCEGEGAFTVGLNQRFRVRRSVGCAVRVRWAKGQAAHGVGRGPHLRVVHLPHHGRWAYSKLNPVWCEKGEPLSGEYDSTI